METLGVGMLGFGTVGSAVYAVLQSNAERIFDQAGGPLSVARIGVRDLSRERPAPAELFTTDLESVVDDPRVSVVLELMGGISPAGELIERALAAGKSVVTANKALLSEKLEPFMRLAERKNVCLEFEAAVGGGIPVIRVLRNQLQGNRILRVGGILNGTTNFILTKMLDDGLDFVEALTIAQEGGYAEADPTADVGGFDTRAKLAILSTLAFGRRVTPDQIHLEGIGGVSADLMQAIEGQYVVKLIAEARQTEEGNIYAMVHPAAVPVRETLGQVWGTENCVHLEGDFVGKLEFAGQGAGGGPTASAVVGDLIEAAAATRQSWRPRLMPLRGAQKVAPFAETEWQYALLVEPQARMDPWTAQVALKEAGLKVYYAKPQIECERLLIYTGKIVEKEFQKGLQRLPKGISVISWLRLYEP